MSSSSHDWRAQSKPGVRVRGDLEEAGERWEGGDTRVGTIGAANAKHKQATEGTRKRNGVQSGFVRTQDAPGNWGEGGGGNFESSFSPPPTDYVDDTRNIRSTQ